MPYSIVNDHPDCEGFAVIKDSNREVLGCHKTKMQAQEQLTALNISEYGTRALPSNYRPALSDDVPEGRACGNCFYYDESRQNEEGDKAWCALWEDFVDGGYYCNRWMAEVEERADPPAPKKDQISGSDKNEPGSAAGKSGGITINAATETALQNKADEHNAAMTKADRPNWTRVRVGALKAVYRRGAGAYSTSHRPGIGRAQWAMARVNAFLYLARTGSPKNKAYVGDNDLLHSDHPRYSKQKESRQESYKPTEAMRVEAQRGLEWRSQFGRGGTEVGIARARDIANGRSLPLETVMRMVSFFARHEVDKQAEGFSPGEDGYPSNGRIAWALWGGDPGKSWAERIAEQNRDYKEDEDDKPRYNSALQILQILKKQV
jgi:hypothetical protein